MRCRPARRRGCSPLRELCIDGFRFALPILRCDRALFCRMGRAKRNPSEEPAMTTPLSRRRALQLGGTALPLVHIRSGRAAGKLALAFRDHWVPGGNDVMTKQIAAWAQTNQVEVTTDYMSAGNKLVITAAA